MLDILEHPNQEKYGGQRVLVVKVEDYVYLVPVIETENEVVLKTIIPSRKATIVILTNDATADAKGMSERILDRLLAPR